MYEKMTFCKLLKRSVLLNRIKLKSRFYSTSNLPDDKIRNIGILAHIDAGNNCMLLLWRVFVILICFQLI